MIWSNKTKHVFSIFFSLKVKECLFVVQCTYNNDISWKIQEDGNHAKTSEQKSEKIQPTYLFIGREAVLCVGRDKELFHLGRAYYPE